MYTLSALIFFMWYTGFLLVRRQCALAFAAMALFCAAAPVSLLAEKPRFMLAYGFAALVYLGVCVHKGWQSHRVTAFLHGLLAFFLFCYCELRCVSLFFCVMAVAGALLFVPDLRKSGVDTYGFGVWLIMGAFFAVNVSLPHDAAPSLVEAHELCAFWIFVVCGAVLFFKKLCARLHVEDICGALMLWCGCCGYHGGFVAGVLFWLCAYRPVRVAHFLPWPYAAMLMGTVAFVVTENAFDRHWSVDLVPHAGFWARGAAIVFPGAMMCVLWVYFKQRKGFPHVSGPLSLCMAVVGAATVRNWIVAW